MLESMLMGKIGGSVGPEAPEEIGVFWEGGYYTGQIVINEKVYALIVAPKAQGHALSTLAVKTSGSNTPGTGSLNDGWSNTQAMIASGATLHPAAKYCRDLVINGYDDWYLPSVNELEMCYRAFKPTTSSNLTGGYGPYSQNGYNPSSSPLGAAYTGSVPAQTNSTIFRSGGSEAFTQTYYWSSTEINSSNAWLQGFTNGTQDVNTKYYGNDVRAVRKVLIG